MIEKFEHGFLNRVYGYQDYTQLEIDSKLIQKIDEVIGECNNAFEFVDWLKEQGVPDKVTEIINGMLEDGTLENLININKINQLKTELTNNINQFKTSTNQTLENMNNTVDTKINENKQLINQTEELVKFERNVFPHSLVTGYINNFLSPTIEYLKEQKKDFKIYILMPTTHEAIEKHKRRVSYLNYMLSDKLDIDSLTNVKLPTSMKRGTIITRICSKDEKYNNIYIDFATTTSAFLDVARYKKENITYKDFSLNDIIAEYSKIFIKQTKNELESDSMYIELFTNIDEMVESIRNNN